MIRLSCRFVIFILISVLALLAQESRTSKYPGGQEVDRPLVYIVPGELPGLVPLQLEVLSLRLLDDADDGYLEVLALVDVLELLLDNVQDLVLPLVVPKLLGLLAGDDAYGLLVRGGESLVEHAANYTAKN